MSAARRRTGRRTTISDVATAAGVSLSTVSNALNGRVSSMRPATLERIMAAVTALDYQPSSLARGLATRHSATIGIILAEIESPLFLQSLHVIEPLARSAGYSLLLSVCASIRDERQALDILMSKQVEGIIFFSTSTVVDESHIADLQHAETPVVIVNRASRFPGFDQVNWDDDGDAKTITDYLVNLGHQRIAYLMGPETRRSTSDRLEGYRRALEQHGLPFDETYVRPGDYTGSPEIWRRSARDLLEMPHRPTAIIASNDTVAATIVRTVTDAGLRVPEDMSIVGHDDQPFTTLLNPTLTTIQEPVMASGRRAMEILLGRIRGEKHNAVHVTLPGKLIVRESTGPAP